MATPMSRLDSSAPLQVRGLSGAAGSRDGHRSMCGEQVTELGVGVGEGVELGGVDVESADRFCVLVELQAMGQHALHAEVGGASAEVRPPAVGRQVFDDEHRVVHDGIDTGARAQLVLQVVGGSGSFVCRRHRFEARALEHGDACPVCVRQQVDGDLGYGGRDIGQVMPGYLLADRPKRLREGAEVGARVSVG